jgi:ABC-type polar amino acid transport system ATPase subunit
MFGIDCLPAISVWLENPHHANFARTLATLVILVHPGFHQDKNENFDTSKSQKQPTNFQNFLSGNYFA